MLYIVIYILPIVPILNAYRGFVMKLRLLITAATVTENDARATWLPGKMISEKKYLDRFE